MKIKDFIIVVLVVLVITIGGFVVYDKFIAEKDIGIVDNNTGFDGNTENDGDNATSDDSKAVGKVDFYSGDKYSLTLVTHYDVSYSNSKGTGVADVYEFILTVDEGYSASTMAGNYRINGNEIELSFIVGCVADAGVGTFNCPLPENVGQFNNGSLTLPYTEDSISLGNVVLSRDK